MKLRILFFASLRETLALDGEDLEVGPEIRCVADVRGLLAARGGAWAEALGAPRNVRAALDQKLARPDTPLHDGAELAFFPPVTGG